MRMASTQTEVDVVWRFWQKHNPQLSRFLLLSQVYRGRLEACIP